METPLMYSGQPIPEMPLLIPTGSGYNSLIPGEIKNDEFYNLIYHLARSEPVATVLEIGSSSGEGSTEAFVRGLRENPARPTLFCMEISSPRFHALKQRYALDKFVKPYNASSVPADKFPSEQTVAQFHREAGSYLSRYPLEQVLSWLRQDMEYLKFAVKAGIPTDGIRRIKAENKIDHFGMVLIDGSEFSGNAELDEVIGANLILLDDFMSFKNYHPYRRLSADPAYVLIACNPNLRNGYAAFRKRS
ncbi:MAG TPA: hypothetical protein VKJ65_07595 [Phycisphaerae bacterium]|nr:hypothetical protein [Phycisphaerae bacterium]